MKKYDWIVIGGGITGSCLSFELVRKGFSVLLLEKDLKSNNATAYSYGGLAYWSGTTQLSRQLCQEGIEIHRYLAAELEGDTEFREIDLLLTIDKKDDPQVVRENYTQFAIPPQLLEVREACELEPLLNPNAIAGVLHLPHGHIHPQKTNSSYQKAFRRLGGEIVMEGAIQLLRQGDRARGVATARENYAAHKVVICAGGLSRSLLQEAAISLPLYFTHAYLIETPATDIRLRTLVMPAVQGRFALEAWASQPQVQSQWDNPSPEAIAQILDPGAIQFLDGHLLLGQISAIATEPGAVANLATAEEQIRQGIANILPSIANLRGFCQHCLVAFTKNAHPFVGEIATFPGVYLFSGFTSTLVIAPPLARHFSNWAAGEADEVMAQIAI